MTMPTRSTPILLTLLLVASIGTACATFGSPTVTDVRTSPSRYQDRTVTVTGVVTSSWGVPLLPFRMYRISDGQSEIVVVSEGDGRIPTRGTRVRVKGRVEDIAVMGGRPLGLHLRERSLKILL